MIELDYEVISHLDEPQEVGTLPRFCAVAQSADSAEQAAVQYVQHRDIIHDRYALECCCADCSHFFREI